MQYNLLTPPSTGPSSAQEGGKRSSVPLYYGFKEVEENWAKHCSAGEVVGPHAVEQCVSCLFSEHFIKKCLSHLFAVEAKILENCCFLLDSNVQPKFYCVLSPEASEDDISRLDSKVHLCPFICYCFNAIV